jgi:ABC-2 type transport system ATP-binding protein
MIDNHNFEEYNRKFKVIHHIKVDDKIRLRILSDRAPTDDAVQVKPTLEDSYLWLLGKDSVGSQR